ncbi:MULTISPECIES: 16S rRNA (guanine(966)-N(2))-methyltransferase RsmD [Sphingomonas]|uniref:16S rRNA (guanine(966)-N(2))-methyltransferase RsmD n=1 Tax=Sphingomonas TaxID=13687 RepID=UPI000DEEACD9|nr:MULTISPECIES: 16S rRNA (guanine(966)-N(2))-methyltransferase RsmD [Sphingomonas]
MRIIAGRWRGRPLLAPPGEITRPTADRIRETLFSMLTSRLGNFAELRVADLYAGSGALGLEALSRGAASALFVETDAAARKVIERNAAALGATIELLATSAERLPPRPAFDLILADPPYADGAGDKVVRAVAAAGWLAPGGWLAIETARGHAIAENSFETMVERDTGRARLTLLRRAA